MVPIGDHGIMIFTHVSAITFDMQSLSERLRASRTNVITVSSFSIPVRVKRWIIDTVGEMIDIHIS